MDVQRATPGISGGFAARPRFDVSVSFGVSVCMRACLCADNEEELKSPAMLHHYKD